MLDFAARGRLGSSINSGKASAAGVTAMKPKKRKQLRTRRTIEILAILCI
jgi:hypothetical protein